MIILSYALVNYDYKIDTILNEITMIMHCSLRTASSHEVEAGRRPGTSLERDCRLLS